MQEDAIRVIESLRAELAAAQARAAELEGRLRHSEQEASALREQQQLVQRRLDGFLANMPGLVRENYFAPDLRVAGKHTLAGT